MLCNSARKSLKNFWKILNKILKCKQVSASDRPKFVNCSRRFDEFCYCFCTSPATVDRPKGCVTCFRVGKKFCEIKVVVVFWREKNCNGEEENSSHIASWEYGGEKNCIFKWCPQDCWWCFLFDAVYVVVAELIKTLLEAQNWRNSI